MTEYPLANVCVSMHGSTDNQSIVYFVLQHNC